MRRTGEFPEVAISPDGTYLVWGSGNNRATNRLFVRSSDQLEATPLRGAEGGVSPFFAPDGERVGFFDRITDTLKTTSVEGGPVISTGYVGRLPPLGASWGPDDTIVFGTPNPSGLWQLEARGANRES